jgi:hypothetical protein
MKLTLEMSWRRVAMALGLAIVIGAMAIGAFAAVNSPLASDESDPESETEEVVEQVYFKRQRLDLKAPERNLDRTESSCLDCISGSITGTHIKSTGYIWLGCASGVRLILSTGSPGQLIFRGPPSPA